jgi:nicotinate-nucleotide--dimethylbenzimidazole phosphoribosyltransferase
MELKITDEQIRHKINNKTKPLGSLGLIEETAFKICRIQDTLTPELKNPHILVFAGDHGIVNDGVCSYPQEVTYQMVMNFLAGGAAINVFARQNSISLKIIDAGVNHVFENYGALTDCKIDMGTKSFLRERAMTLEQCMRALTNGRRLVDDVFSTGCNVIGFGEMGIGNTSSASLIMHKLTGIPVEECTGRGAGLSDEGLGKKIEILKKASELHNTGTEPMEILSSFGGFEVVTMTGAFLQAAEKGMVMLVDGFIASAAFLAAYYLNKNILNNAVFCHRSDEPGHIKVLRHLGVKALLDFGMRLGEGTGCAAAYPALLLAVNFMNEMASFDEAGVSKESN